MSFFIYTSFAETLFNADFWVYFLVGGLIFAIITVLQGMGLYTIAKREGLKHRWMAFVPFLNTYYTGVCAQKNRCLNMNPKIVGIVAAVVEVIIFAGYTVWYVADILLSLSGCIRESYDTYYGFITGYELQNVPEYLNWAAWCFNYLYQMNILYYAYLVFILLQIVIYSAFFQTYASRRYFIFTFSGALCSLFFPIYGILTYVVRNNRGMNYKDFMHREQEKQYRAYQQYYHQNGQNPYDTTNPYSRQGGYAPPPDGYNNNANNSSQTNNNSSNSADDPFSEFGSSSGSDSDPFDDGSN